MIKWILFDLGNVIVKHVFEGKQYYSLRGKFFSGTEVESIYSLKEYEEFAKGIISEQEFVRKFLEISNLNLTVSEFLEIYQRDIRPIPYMKELIENLSSNYSLAILTNEGKAWADRKIDTLNIREFFDKIVISADLHELKPEKEFYHKALNILEAKPEECLLIDDKEKNCKTAKEMGIKTIRFIDLENLKKEITLLSINIDQSKDNP